MGFIAKQFCFEIGCFVYHVAGVIFLIANIVLDLIKTN